MPTRSDALALLQEHVHSPSLLHHCLAVEAVMRTAAEREGGDVELWGMTALLHDFDYEAHPGEHPFWGRPLLERAGYPPELVIAIQAHATFSGVPRDTRLARWLFATDELTGFVTAVAMVQPGRALATVRPDSVRRKLKSKSFARSVNRADISTGLSELGLELDQLVELMLTALTPIAADLGLG